MPVSSPSPSPSPHLMEFLSWLSSIGSFGIGVIGLALTAVSLLFAVRSYRDSKAAREMAQAGLDRTAPALAERLHESARARDGDEPPASPADRDLGERSNPDGIGAGAATEAVVQQQVTSRRQRARRGLAIAGVTAAVGLGLAALSGLFAALVYFSPVSEHLQVVSSDRTYESKSDKTCSGDCRTLDYWQLPEGAGLHAQFRAEHVPTDPNATTALVLQVAGCDRRGLVEWRIIVDGAVAKSGRTDDGEDRVEFPAERRQGFQLEAQRVNTGRCTLELGATSVTLSDRRSTADTDR